VYLRGLIACCRATGRPGSIRAYEAPAERARTRSERRNLGGQRQGLSRRPGLVTTWPPCGLWSSRRSSTQHFGSPSFFPTGG
jgi:hypothetical protein